MKDSAERFDVVVVGGGAAGTAAAVAAQRLGARTLLVERYGFLGGAATNAQVLSYCGFYRRDDPGIPPNQAQLTIGGIGVELLHEVSRCGIDVAPTRAGSGNWIVMIDAEAVKVALDRLVGRTSTALALHTLLVHAEMDGDRVDSIVLADHRGLRRVTAGAFVDASGEASLSAFSGARMRQTGGDADLVQPASLPVRIGGIPDDVVFDRKVLSRLVSDHNRSSDLRILRANGGVIARLPLSSDVWWMVIDVKTDGISSGSLSMAERAAREQAWSFIEVLRKHPGCERAYLVSTGPQIGIRETRRPYSLMDATGEDGLAGTRQVDCVARASWPMEVHEAPGRVRFVPIGGDGFFDISHRSLRVPNATNLRLAGRVVGSDADAYGSIRVMGTAFATGQAAGVSAALSALKDCHDSLVVRAHLEEQGALI